MTAHKEAMWRFTGFYLACDSRIKRDYPRYNRELSVEIFRTMFVADGYLDHVTVPGSATQTPSAKG